MNALSSLEWSLQAGLSVIALVAALASARRALAPEGRATGELVWAAVAVLVLAAVIVAVSGGGSGAV